MNDEPAQPVLQLDSQPESAPPVTDARFAGPVGGAVYSPRYARGPRGLVVFWCLWLMGSWAMVLWVESPVPAVRWMILGAVVGLMLFWPALRLSQETSNRAGRVTLGPGTILADWFTLNMVLQVVVWPLRLYVAWSVEQTLWVAAAMAAWSLLTGLVIAWSILPPAPPVGGGGEGGASVHFRRALAMLLCLLLVAGEPIALGVVGLVFPELVAGWKLRVSPLQAMWELTNLPADWTLARWPAVVASVTAAAVLGWCVLAARVKWTRPGWHSYQS